MRRGGIVSSRGLGLVLAVLICNLIFSSPSLRADGKFYPETAYKVPPNIPGQRAIIVYKDGIEKLIVESSLDGPGKEFGWIIPVPSRPTELEKTSPGFIKTLSLAVQPKITHDIGHKVKVILYFSLAVILWFIRVITKKPEDPIVSLFWFFICFFVIYIFSMPLLGKAHTLSAGGDFIAEELMSGVRLLEIKEVGSYTLAVLDANNADALDKWLVSNDFSGLQKDDRAIVNDYIREKWCFVAAKLKRQSDGGFSQPHPLAMSFTAQTPVYPMRLTSTAGSEVYLEIFLIAYKGANCDGLKLEFSDEFFYQKKSYYHDLPGFVSSKFHQRIGHPQAFNTMWDGCVLSRFCGTLNPSEMKKDIVFELKNKGPYRAHYWSNQGAILTSVVVFLLSLCVGLFLLTICFYKKINSYGYKFGLSKVASNSLLLSIVAGLCTFVLLPKIEIIVGKSRGHLSAEMSLHEAGLMIEASYFDYTKQMENIDINDIHKKISEDLSREVNEKSSVLAERLKNPYTGHIMKNEDSPGNYTIFKDRRGIVWRAYFLEGYPFDFVLGPHGEIVPEQQPGDMITPMVEPTVNLFDSDAVLYK